ncbi:dTDP-4-dehydrorhamnose 3,5-epimerase family protein [Dietzia cercidiphylli]|uniref:dTDP-4-dehydrorhamnose 3,5-epimerase family protein n=1 Tax=Dietzia TaxID=37914 RepID=UPI0027E06F79|nr:dTDP-4-dehydrorhamnose 3,5-epimerase [Dietzia psychralcaliphila]
MSTRPLGIEGAHVVMPPRFDDERGHFSPFLLDSQLHEIGADGMFALRQGATSVSRAGVARGIHFTRTPPGTTKYVMCTAGRVRDYLVDLRVGSPTRGVVESVLLDGHDLTCLLIPSGVGHAFHSLLDGSRMLYLMSGEYVPEDELAVDLYDPEIGLDLPDPREVVLSERDRNAPSAAELEASGMLPDYEESLRADAMARGSTAERTPAIGSAL